MKYDVIVIGSGMSGLIAAAKAATRGKSVLIITKGQGTLPITSGCIDLWGYSLENSSIVAPNPYQEIRKLSSVNNEHPYAKTIDVLKESVEFFREVLKSSNYDMFGSLYENQTVFTALGTERISAFVPLSMVVEKPKDVRQIIAVGFKNYADFFPLMFLDNIGRKYPEAEKIAVNIDLGIEQTLRSGYLSILLEREEVLNSVLKQIGAELAKKRIKKKNCFDNSKLFVFPAVLGNKLNYKVWQSIRDSLAAQVIETPGLPPSIPGQKLNKALVLFLRKQGVDFWYNSEVTNFTVEKRKITSLIVQDSSQNQRQINSDSVILASGSFIGGGLVAKKDKIIEPIFQIPVVYPENKSQNSNFLSLDGQAFLSSGVETDNNLRPVSNIHNLYAVGSILAHANYASEKNGLGVAIVTGYKAGSIA